MHEQPAVVRGRDRTPIVVLEQDTSTTWIPRRNPMRVMVGVQMFPVKPRGSREAQFLPAGLAPSALP